MLNFMKYKVIIPAAILGLLMVFFSFRMTYAEKSEAERRSFILKTVVSAVQEGHFSPRPVDDSLSAQVYERMLRQLDYEKKFFIAEDIGRLKEHQFQIDDQIRQGSTAFFDLVNKIFHQRIEEAEKISEKVLSRPFDFSVEEQVELNGEKLEFTENREALEERWRKNLKYRSLARYVDLLKAEERKKEDSADYLMRAPEDLEKEAREFVSKNQQRYFKRLKKFSDFERFTLYVNSITSTEDPHTQYMPPRDKERFDVAMSGTFFGIGAQLKEEDGKIKVVAIIPGSPCWKQGQLKAGDEIIKVAQGETEPVDIQGFDIEDAVEIIRGEKGTEVRLTVKKVNGAEEVIPIIRGEVHMEDVFAKSAVIESEWGPVGYIYLPEFYADFQNIGGPRSSTDVAKEVNKLKEEGVRGIILDLRYNGGGSLSDVVDIAGLFIDQGPVVQVKSASSAPVLLKDNQPGMLYDGPLAVMVNHASASASEILAAVLQDYRRAVVVGQSTFGKGTVQKVISLDQYLGWMHQLQNKQADLPEIGSLKLTVQKFYRVNGGSTQLRGVDPDIPYPDSYDHITMGEGREKSALPWDEIPAANYTLAAIPVNVEPLAKASKARIAANETFQLIEENALRIKRQDEDNRRSLDVIGFRKEQEEANLTAKKMEALQENADPLHFYNPQEDLPKIQMDSTSIQKNEDWIKNLQKDIYIAETVKVIGDLFSQHRKLTMGGAKQ